MKIKKISFCAKGSIKEGSFRIPFIWMRSILNKKYDCFDNHIHNSMDLYICKAGQGLAKEIRLKIVQNKISINIKAIVKKIKSNNSSLFINPSIKI